MKLARAGLEFPGRGAARCGPRLAIPGTNLCGWTS